MAISRSGATTEVLDLVSPLASETPVLAMLFAPLRAGLRARLQLVSPPPVVPAVLDAEAGWRGAAIHAWRKAGIAEQELLAWADADPGGGDPAATSAGDAAT